MESLILQGSQLSHVEQLFDCALAELFMGQLIFLLFRNECLVSYK